MTVIEPGMLTTVQDLGRHGYAHMGVPPGGAADALSLTVCNRLCGNRDAAPGLEMTLTGVTLEFDGAAQVVLSAGTGQTVVGRAGESPRRVEPWTVTSVAAGDRLRVGPILDRARAYLALAGGLEVPLVLGGAGVCLSGGFGGLFGRALRAGDSFDVVERVARPMRPSAGASQPLLEVLSELGARRVMRCVPGAQQGAFGREAIAGFLGATYAVSNQSSRAGVCLEGPVIKAPGGGAMISEGMAWGAVEVPPDGRPIVLLADLPVTGGYPVIACVIAADLPRLGQLRPRDSVRFELIGLEEARSLYRAQRAALDAAIAPL